MINKGQCLTCKYCETRDDGYERKLVCIQTKYGRTLTWHMHTGKSEKVLDGCLRMSMKDRIPPKWCVFRQKES